MKLDEEHSDSIISVRTIPDINDHLFLLTKSGMMIRFESLKPRKPAVNPPEVPE